MAKKQVPAWVQENFPDWKKNLWGMGRAFIGAFIPTFALMLTSIEVESFESKETVVKLVASIGVASITAGFIGVGKFLRDAFPESFIVNKLPI